MLTIGVRNLPVAQKLHSHCHYFDDPHSAIYINNTSNIMYKQNTTVSNNIQQFPTVIEKNYMQLL